MCSNVDTHATSAVGLIAISCVFTTELLYYKLVTSTQAYSNNSDQFARLNKRQTELKKKEEKTKLAADQRNEYQSNITSLRTLKRTIQKQRHINHFINAVIMAIVIKLLSAVYENVTVAKMPFRPPRFIYKISTYNLLEPIENDEWTPVSAPALFVLMFISIKFIIRKLFFKSTIRLYSSGFNGIAFPRKMFLKSSGSSTTHFGNWEDFDFLYTFLGMIVSSWYQVYTLYKAAKKYDDIKYIVSITRNVSRLTGFICGLWVPRPIRYLMYGAFAKVYGIDMDEVEEPDFGHYETFTKFFTRRLKAGVRETHEPKNAKSMCSPCDGRVLTCGLINSEFSTIDCVKGRSYRLDEFMLGTLGNEGENNQISDIPNNTQVAAMLDKVKQRGNQLMYMVIYLSPADYHRFHSPAIHTGDYRRHIVGYLSPVKPSHVNKHKDVFKNNERVNIFGRWAQGFYFESAVGATNVGSVKLDFDTEVLTNKALPQYPYYEDKNYIEGLTAEKAGPFYEYLNSTNYDNNLYNSKTSKVFEKAEMTGRFEMGSTVVLVFEADQKTELKVKPGKKLWLGQEIVSHKD